MSAVISLLLCPHGHQALDVGDKDSGYRFAGGKCCGHWRAVKSWPIGDGDLKRTAAEFLRLAAPSTRADNQTQTTTEKD